MCVAAGSRPALPACSDSMPHTYSGTAAGANIMQGQEQLLQAAGGSGSPLHGISACPQQQLHQLQHGCFPPWQHC